MSESQRRNPFDGVVDYFSELGRMRELGTRGQLAGQEVSERTHASAWVPATDILAVGEDLLVRVEAAGVEDADVDISFSHGSLIISGVRRSEVGGIPVERQGDDIEFYVRERFSGEFRRVIALHEGVKRDQISARLDHGLVVVTVKGGAHLTADSRIALSAESGSTELPTRE